MSRVTLLVSGLGVLVLAAAAAGAWLVADRVARGLLVPSPYGLQAEFELLDYLPSGDDPARGEVVLPLAGSQPVAQFARVDAEGRYGLMWDDSGSVAHGVLGPVSARDERSVTRPLSVVEGAPPVAGAAARLDVTIYRRDPLADHGVAFEEVRIAGPSGAVAAWWIDRASDSAVVMVHGRRRGERNEALRALPSALSSGVSVLVTSYRNHDLSDPSPDGLFHYGASEAEDLLAALQWLRAHGVERVVLVTYSMGAAVAMVAMERWPSDGPRLLGLTMDAPLVDPREVVALGVKRAGLPSLAATLGFSLASRRAGVDLAGLDLRSRAAQLQVPLLLQMTALDGTIPVELVDDFAARVPDELLSYRRLPRGDHVEAWNVDPEGYEAALESFLDELLETRAAAPRR